MHTEIMGHVTRCSCGTKLRQEQEDTCFCCGTMVCDSCFFECSSCGEVVCARCVGTDWECTFCQEDDKKPMQNGTAFIVVGGEKVEIENSKDIIAFNNANPLSKIEINVEGYTILDFKYKTTIYNYKTKEYDHLFTFEERRGVKL